MTQTIRTYGEIRRLTDSQGRPGFGVRAEPHVVMRLKRIFPRVRQERLAAHNWLLLYATPDIAFELQWILSRWPMTGDALPLIEQQAKEYQAEQERIVEVLAGQGDLLTTLREPLREPREYQKLAAELILSGPGRLLLGDDVGLGKTFTAMLTLLADDALPAVFVTLTHLPKQMQRELAKSLPWLTSHVATRGKAYDPCEQDKTLTARPDVLFLNYAKLPGWADALRDARTVIFDEAQELRTGPGTYRYQAAQALANDARYVIGLTATPVYNYGGEVWNLFNVLSPDSLGSHDEFIREWGAGERSGKTTVKDPAALGTYLRDQGLLLARTRKDVGRELPPALRITQSIEADPADVERLSGDAAELARLFLDPVTTGKDRFRLAGDLDWKLRQATGIVKAPLVAAFVRLLLESEQRIVLFGWHRAVYDLWLSQLGAYAPRLYTGTETPREKELAVDAFLDDDNPCRVLILSLRAGAGLDGLQEKCKVAVFGELDWSPGIHHQCIGRLARDGMGADPVLAYFLVAESGSDPVIAEVLQLKRGQAEPLMNPTAKTFGHSDAGKDRTRQLAESFLASHERTTDRPEAVPAPGPGQLDLVEGSG